MKNTLLLIISCFLVGSAQAQLDCGKKFTMRVIAESGLNMRSEPSLKSKVVVTVPYDSNLVSCQSTVGEMMYDDRKGYWRKSVYKGKTGYMFDGFLEILSLKATEEPKLADTIDEAVVDTARADTVLGQQAAEDTQVPEKPGQTEKPKRSRVKYQFVTEAYNFCGDVQEINPGLLWYGFYPADPEQGEVNYQIKPVELSIVLSRTKLGEGMEFDIETDREERSIFLLGTSRKLDHENIQIEDISERMQYSGSKVFPGQEVTLKKGSPSMKLSATGSVKTSGPCPDLENYKLVLRSEELGVEQNLNDGLPSGKCGLPEIYWYGDFTGDGLPELILVSVEEEQNTFTLLVSDPRLEGALLRKQTDFTLKECYE